ncbi:MAG: tetratricopeptide repeat-containing protein [Flavisolibacter sp.]
MGQYDEAINRFATLLSMEKASFNISTLEKYCNARAKKCVADYLKNGKSSQKYVSEINGVIADLNALLKIGATSERYNLLGSAVKRKVILCKTKPEKLKLLSQAAFYYHKAYSMHPDQVYSVSNWLEMEGILELAGHHKWSGKVGTGNNSYILPSLEDVEDQLSKLSEKLQRATVNRMDYWDMVALANLKLCQAMLNNSVEKTKALWQEALEIYRQTWAKAGSKGKRVAEKEHLELLADALSIIKKPNAVELRKNIEKLKEELEKLI